MSAKTKGRKRMLGTLHPSGLNRKARRTETAMERKTPQRERDMRAQDHHDLQAAQRKAAVKKQQSATHARAVARKKK